jgi:predicted phage baseplate assembly protein
MVQAGQLTTLMTRPFGVKEVTNPNDAPGAADAETVDKARENTPLTVLTLDRVVSLRDFEDFARAFAGIDKARADRVWAGQTRLVYITVTGAEGTAVEEDSTTYKNLEKAIKDYSNGRQPFGIGSYTSLSFYIKANITVDSQYEEETVKEDVKTTLEESYSFEERRLGQTVTKSEVLAMIQAVEGVKAVDLDELYMAGETAALNTYLVAGQGRWDPGLNQPVPAQLLTLAPNGAAIYLMETKS